MSNSDTQESFEFAIKAVKEFKTRPTDQELLFFYSHYKQATIGKCNTKCPGFLDFAGKAKWNAWNELGNMSKEDAMTAYCDQYLKLSEKYN